MQIEIRIRDTSRRFNPDNALSIYDRFFVNLDAVPSKGDIIIVSNRSAKVIERTFLLDTHTLAHTIMILCAYDIA